MGLVEKIKIYLTGANLGILIFLITMLFIIFLIGISFGIFYGLFYLASILIGFQLSFKTVLGIYIILLSIKLFFGGNK